MFRVVALFALLLPALVVIAPAPAADEPKDAKPEDFVTAGGMLSIAFEHDAIQFEVNLASAREAHFRVSSRLLALAHRVVEQTESSKSQPL